MTIPTSNNIKRQRNFDRKNNHVLDQKTKLNAAWQSAGPEQRRAINLEIGRLMAKIRLLHTTAEARYAEEGEALLRESRER